MTWRYAAAIIFSFYWNFQVVQKVHWLIFKQESFGKYFCNKCLVMKEVKIKDELGWVIVQSFGLVWLHGLVVRFVKCYALVKHLHDCHHILTKVWEFVSDTSFRFHFSGCFICRYSESVSKAFANFAPRQE